jgi:hypothetical protein
MSESASRLPARPSLEQLRKRAKELLHQHQTGDTAAGERFRAFSPRPADPGRSEEATLADAQFVLAREHGFESWANLVHHIEAVQSSGRLEQFERLATDYLAAYAGDADALQRLGSHFGVSYTADKLRERVREHLGRLFGTAGAPMLAEVRLMIARQYGFEDWAALAQGLSQPPDDARASRLGLSSAPPFYRIDAKHNTIEPRPPLSDGDWDTIFGVMKEMNITGISAASMTDGAMERLSRLDFVTRVNVGGARQLTDDGLRHLARMPQLEELDLSGYHSPLTDRGLEVLRHLKELGRFEMCWPQHVTDAGVANLSFCDHLESVNLLGTPTGDGAIQALAGKRDLRRFSSGRLVTDAGLPLLHHFPLLETWHGGEVRFGLMSFEAEPTQLLLDGPFTDKGLAGLAGLDGLCGLTFFWHVSALTADGLKPLADLPNLAFLGCQGELCNDTAMRHIGAMPRLRMLMGQGTVASDDGFEALSRSRTIEYIWGRECPNLTGRGFAALAAMPALRGLAVSCKYVDAAALSALPRFPALRALMPMDVPDDGFRHVGRCEQLEDLWCMYCRDTGDIATGHLAGLSRLKTYYAGVTRITDRSLEVLGRLSSLESIELYECAGITNVGLAFLAGLPRLREVTLEGSSGVTREGVAVFPASVRVNYRS